jgi:hypothetical protein
VTGFQIRKTAAFCAVFGFLYPLLLPTPLLIGWSLGTKYLISIGGTIAGTFIANAVHHSGDKRTLSYKRLQSLFGSFCVLVAVGVLIFCIRRFENKPSGEGEVILSLVCVFVGALSTSAITFLMGRLSRLI